MADKNRVPVHVGLIMDGNGRWAKKRLRPRSFGHSAGMRAMMAIARRAKELDIKFLTVYALSTENIANRPQDELKSLFNLMRKYFSTQVKELYANGAKVKIIGDIAALPRDIYELLVAGEKNSPADADFTLVFAINYGSRSEIVRAAKKLAERGENVDEESLGKAMYTGGIPDPDLIIRTGGEVRLSNFLCWQAAYSELYFTPVLFPDFTPEEFDKAIAAYSERNRRYGGV